MIASCNCACHSADSRLQKLNLRKQQLNMLKQILSTRISILRSQLQELGLRRELQVQKNNYKQYSLRQFSQFQFVQQDRIENTLPGRTRFLSLSPNSTHTLGQQIMSILQINSLLMNHLDPKLSYQKQSQLLLHKTPTALPKCHSPARKALKKQNVLPIDRNQFWVLSGQRSLKQRELFRHDEEGEVSREKVKQLLDRFQQLMG